METLWKNEFLFFTIFFSKYQLLIVVRGDIFHAQDVILLHKIFFLFSFSAMAE